MATNYPSALDVKGTSLFDLKNKAETVLTQDLTADALYVYVSDLSQFRSYGGICWIGAEQIRYTALQDNNGVTATTGAGRLVVGTLSNRGYGGTTAAAAITDASIQQRWSADHHNNVLDAVVAIETALGINLSNIVSVSRQVIAGSGLTGGGALSSDVTLNVGAGTGISVAADVVSIDQSFSPTWTGSHTFSHATAPIITAKLGPASGQQHTVPAVTSDTFALLAATQTLSGKTFSGATNFPGSTVIAADGKVGVKGTPTDDFHVFGNTTITGNLTVQGTTVTVNSTNVSIADNIFILNKDEAGAGVSLQYAGIEIERGSVANSRLVFDEATDSWLISYDGGSSYDTVVERTRAMTLTNKTLTTPTIGDFSNATHSHQNAAGGGTLDHGLALTGLGDDDHTQYVHNSTARTISAVHTFNPGSAQAPFTLGANATGQLVTGLNADKLDSQEGSYYQNASNINAGNLAVARMPVSGNWALTGDLGITGASIAVGAATVDTKAIFELVSTTKGFLPPRMTGTQRDAITSPSSGLIVYNTDTAQINVYNGSVWRAVETTTFPWSALTSPASNLTLAMGANTTSFTWNATTGANNLFTFTDTSGNTGTGYLVTIGTASSSAAKPLRVQWQGNNRIVVDENGYIGIGGSPVSNTVLGISGTSGAPTNDQGQLIYVSGTINKQNSGTHTTFASAWLTPWVAGTGSAAVTNGATLYISGAPSGATNNYAMYIAGGSNALLMNTTIGAVHTPSAEAGSRRILSIKGAATDEGAFLELHSFGTTVVNQYVGAVTFWNNATEVGNIRMFNAVGGTSNSGYMIFETGDAGTVAERMRITQNGSLMLAQMTSTAATSGQMLIQRTQAHLVRIRGHNTDTNFGNVNGPTLMVVNDDATADNTTYIQMGTENNGASRQVFLGFQSGTFSLAYDSSVTKRFNFLRTGDFGAGITDPTVGTGHSLNFALAAVSGGSEPGIKLIGRRTADGAVGVLDFYNNPSGSTYHKLGYIQVQRSSGDDTGIMQFYTMDDGTNQESARLGNDDDIADTETALYIRRNVGGSLTLQKVSMGAADSGGAGYKVLRVPN